MIFKTTQIIKTKNKATAVESEFPMPDVMRWRRCTIEPSHIIVYFYNSDVIRIVHDITEFKKAYSETRSNYNTGITLN